MKEDLAQLASRMGRALSFEQLDRVMAEMDASGAGAIRFDEFCGWWTKHLARSKTTRKNRGAAVGTGLGEMMDTVYEQVTERLRVPRAALSPLTRTGAPRAQVSKGNSAERLRTNGQIVRVMSAFEGMRATQLQIVFDALDVDGCGILQKPDVARCARLGSSQRAEAAP